MAVHLHQGSAVAATPWMASLVALSTITVEFFYPVALFSSVLPLPMVLGGIGLVIGIRMLMGPTFEHFLLITSSGFRGAGLERG